MYVPSDAIEVANQLLEEAKAHNVTIATAESCTAGLIAATLTEIPGSSSIFDRGFVTYSNEAKTEMIGVPADLIANHGAVSEEVAMAMSAGALKQSDANLTVSVTGIAGPGGGSAEKPVGLVHFSVASDKHPQRHDQKLFAGMDRENVRAATVEHALIMLLETLTGKPYHLID